MNSLRGDVEQTVSATDADIATVLKYELVIPAFQRDYSWAANDEAWELLDDLLTAFGEDGNGGFGSRRGDDYLMGQVVLAGREARMFLVDGQQRVITLTLLVAALVSRLEAQPVSPGPLPPTLVEALAVVFPNDADSPAGQARIRLTHHDESVNQVLRELAESRRFSDETEVTSDSVSAKRIREVFDVFVVEIQDRVEGVGTFDDARKRLLDFLQYVLHQGKLIVTSTLDEAAALVVFERANFRGKDLDAADLLKNLIFQNLDRSDFESISASWRDLRATIRALGRGDVVQFLRWFHMSREGARFYSTQRSLYPDIRKHADAIGISSDPIRYVDSLRSAAKALSSVVLDSTQSGANAPSNGLLGIRYFSANQKQHLPLLMSASHWPEMDFERLTRALEALLLTVKVGEVKSQTYERLLRDITLTSPVSPSDEEGRSRTIEDVVKRTRELRVQSLYVEQFRRLSYRSNRLAVRYVLTLVHDHLENLAVASSGKPRPACGDPEIPRSTSVWGRSAEVEIEHIHGLQFQSSFGDGRADVNQIGNLGLIDKPTNVQLRSLVADEKLVRYGQLEKKFAVLRNLRSVVREDQRTRRDIVGASLLTNVTSWSPETAQALADKYRSQVDEALGFPPEESLAS